MIRRPPSALAAASAGLALTLAFALAAPVAASEAALDGLAGLCTDDGRPAAECACLRKFVADNFQPREIEGAWIVFGNPELESNPPKAIRALLDRGYTMPEIVDVFERVSALETEAKRVCTAEGAAAPGDAARG
jgi:hypothetical protein